MAAPAPKRAPTAPRRAWWPPVLPLAVVVGLGVALRAHDLDRSPWVDELGTLWVVEAGARELVTRALAFQGQTPLAYVPHWLAVGLLGESAWALRAPSLAFGLALGLVAFLLGRAGGGRRAGALACGLVAAHPVLVASSREARPYALGVLLGALALLGLVRALRTRGGRGLPLLGLTLGALAWAHPVLFAPQALAAAATLLLARGTIPLRASARAGALALAVAAPALAHAAWLARRRDELAWLDADLPRAAALVGVLLGPWLAVAALGRLLARRAPASGPPAAPMALALSALAPPVVLALAHAGGVHLLDARYLATAAVPACALAAVEVARAGAGPGGAARARGLATLLAAGLTAALGLGLARADARYVEGWREAVAAIRQEVARRPGPVLFRAGLVEEDQRLLGRAPPGAALAPLRPPGASAPDELEVIPLTYRPDAAGLPAWLERHVAPALAGVEDRAYLLSRADRGYADWLVGWVERRFPGRFVAAPTRFGQGVVVWVLARRR